KRLQVIKENHDPERDGPWAEVEKKYNDRLALEIDLIRQKGFVSYFLIVQDFINWAKDRQIPVGPGRGSAAGSLVSYALRITNIDPMQYGLLFERFLNPERLDNPDIDIDFCAERREEVLHYVADKYGKDTVSQIAAFGSMKAKAVVKDVGRALGYSYSEVEQIAKLIPDDLNMTLEKAEKDPDIAKLLKDSDWVKELWFHAKALEGLARHCSTHAAGVIIADRPLADLVPLMLDKDEKLVTQFDKNDVERVGLIKFDFLGLKTLTVIDKALAIIREVYGETIDIDQIPLHDPEVFDLLGRGLSTGVFQFESLGMKDLLVRIHPDSIEDLTAINALYRPGPIGSGMIDDFIARKKGAQEVKYDLPELEPLLKSTYGLMAYQEQVQQVAHEIGGFSLGEADLMRRAMAKKKVDQMASFQEKFTAGSKAKNIPGEIAQHIWNLMEKFAEYGFNKSHSAAYAMVAYQTAWLKAKYPAPFMAALMTMDKGDSDKIMTKIAECRDLAIEVLPPDVNESAMDFSVNKKGQIRFGMAAVKNVGEGAVRSIIEARAEKGPFQGLYDFTRRVDMKRVNKRVLESLIKCGAFDSTHPNRAALLAALESAVEQSAREQADRDAGQTSMFGLLGGRQETREPALPDVEPWSKQENLRVEKEALGFFITGHPLDHFRNLCERFASVDSERLREMTEPQEVRIAAVITSLDKKTTKAGKPMAVGLAEDQKSPFKITLFSEGLEKSREVLENIEQPFLLFGKADIREGGNGLLIDRIIPLVKAAEVCSNE
ncbi:MAG TPA: DNA polymerase III subunit alpha, partial [bacterium]|nr:DNA polymerase III subunit alpha [bacterium]